MLCEKENNAKKRALQAQYTNAQELLNVEHISSYLFTKDMLSVEEMEELASPCFTRKKKIDLLVREILMSKSDWWDDWLWCLQESSTQPGLLAHGTLAKLLETELEQQLKEYKVASYIAIYIAIVIAIISYLYSFIS